MTTPEKPEVQRINFENQQEYAAFAMRSDSPRYSAICCMSFYDEQHSALGIAPGEALFSDNFDALRKTAIAWDRNQLKVSIAPMPADVLELFSDAPDRLWRIEASPDFPDDLIEFAFEWNAPSLDADEETVAAIALDRLCDQDDHPLIFIDKQAKPDLQYLIETLDDKPIGFSS